MIVGLSEKGKEIVKELMPILPYKFRKYIKIGTNVFNVVSENGWNSKEFQQILKSIRK